MPLRYTEIVAEHESPWYDHAVYALFDIFSNRVTALFCLAWREYRLPFRYEVDSTRYYLPPLLSLAEAADKTLRRDFSTAPGFILDEALTGYVAAVQHRPVSTAYPQRMLSDYLQAPTRVEQLVGGWHCVPALQYTRLGNTNNALGTTALADERVWQRDLRARLQVGPLEHAQYRNFLSGASSASALRRVLTILYDTMPESEIKLVLHQQDVIGSTLDNNNDGRLGWGTFLCSRPTQQDRSDTQYTFALLH